MGAGGRCADFKATAHKVAVVSLLGDTFNFATGAKPVAGAGFDALVEDVMVKQIKADVPGVIVTKVDDAAHADLLSELYPSSGSDEDGMGNLRQALRLWAAEHGVDYVVVFRKGHGEPFPGAPFFGIGLMDKPGKAGKQVPAAILNVTVLDGSSLAVSTDLSARDTDWSQRDYPRGAPDATWLPHLVDDAKAMLASMAPALVKGAGL